MLRWRLSLGALLIGALALLSWLDATSARPGAYLGALAVAAGFLATGELLAMFRTRGFDPSPAGFYLAAMLPVLFCGVPILFPPIVNNVTMGAHGWLAVGLIAGLATVFLAEMARFDGSGRSMGNVAATAFATLYIGGCLGAIVQLRLVRAPLETRGLVGLQPLLVFLITVKLSDTCQYFVGRSLGKRKLSPKISPGKTWEGAIGGIALACLIVSLTVGLRRFGWDLLTWQSFAMLMAFTASIAVAGLIGDLSESMLKRDAGMKDSSTWLPGFGGVLDLLDSLLLAAPMAYLWFVNGFLDFPLAG